jgi:hypothetical protein
MSNLPAKPKTAVERLQALARAASNDTLLKYNSGHWTISEVPVPAGTRFIAFPDQVTHQWTHFADNKFVKEIVALVAEDVDGDVELKIVKGNGRDDLGNDDKSLWEEDSAGEPRDPWNYGLGLPLVNAETGAFVVFKIGSRGGMGAIAGLVASYTRNKHLGYPVVTLSTDSYKNKRFGGYTSYPVFITVGYDTPPAPVIESHGNGPVDGGNGARVIENKADADIDIIESNEPVRIDRADDDPISTGRPRKASDMDDDIPFAPEFR